jgi:hypothetical protein
MSHSLRDLDAASVCAAPPGLQGNAHQKADAQHAT